MIIAIEMDSIPILQVLHEYGADVNLVAGGATALHFAVELGKPDIVSFLLSLPGCVPDIHTGSTPLHVATAFQTVNFVRMLLDAGANIDAHIEGECNTPLTSAICSYRPENACYLISRGAKINIMSPYGHTPLMDACNIGALPVVRALLSTGQCDLNMTSDRTKETALDIANRKDMYECAIEVWAAGGEPASTKPSSATNGVGILKWMRPRIFGRHVLHSGGKPIDSGKPFSPLVSPSNTFAFNEPSEAPVTTDVLFSNLPPPPLPRSDGSATSIGNRIYLFGGQRLPHMPLRFNPEVSPTHELNEPVNSQPSVDFWRLDLDSLRYASLVPVGAKKSPTHFTIDLELIQKSRVLGAGDDGLTVRYIDENLEDASPICAVSNGAYIAEDGFSYFEVHVISSGARNCVAVGMVGENYDLTQMPGWDHHSVGLHSDDAVAFYDTGDFGRQWGNRYGAGDTMGCGIVWETGEVFYALNGEFLGVSHRVTCASSLRAAIGLTAPGAHVKFNFGAKPFLFDFRAPTLQWQQLSLNSFPRLITPFDAPFTIHTIGEALILLGGPHSSYRQQFWHWQGSQWGTLTATGEIPRIQGSSVFTALNHDLYAFIHDSESSIRSSYPRLPVLLRLRLTFEGADSAHGAQRPFGETTPRIASAEWQQVFPKANSVVLDEDLQEHYYHAYNLISEEFKEALIVSVEGKLCFLSSTALALLNVDTFEIDFKPFSGQIPSLFNHSVAVIGHFVEYFGGWDSIQSRNDVHILDTRTGAWIMPHVLGILPRSRTSHLATRVQLRNPNVLKGNTFDDECTASSVQSHSGDPKLASNVLVHMFGWNGQNCMDDLEILSVQHVERKNQLASLIKPIGRVNDPVNVNFTQVGADGIANWLSTSAIVVAARASKLREQILSAGASLTILIPEKHPWALFVSFITYLHDDLADIKVDGDDSRRLYAIFEEYAPEHSKRVIEALILTHVNIRSRMPLDMEWAFNTESFKDVKLTLRPSAPSSSLSVVSAHKCVLISQSTYFRSLLQSSGMIESHMDEIELIEEVDVSSFRLVVRFLYTLQLDLESLSDCIFDVYELSCKYGIDKLRNQVESTLTYNLSVDNVISILQLAETYQSTTLKRECLQFLQFNLEQVSQTPEYAENEQLLRTAFPSLSLK